MVVPLFTAFIPVSILIIFPLFKLKLPGIGLLITLGFSCISLMSPLITMTFVGSFRRRIMYTICPIGRFRKIRDSSFSQIRFTITTAPQ